MADSVSWAPPDSDFQPATSASWSPPTGDFAPVYDAALFKQRVGRDPEPQELATFKQFKGQGFAGDTSRALTPAEAAQAVASGVNSGAMDLLGAPVDTARNVLELGKAGAGFAYNEATGNGIPSALQPNEHPENDVGSSAWIKAQSRRLLGSNTVDVSGDPNSWDLQALHTGSEIAGPAPFAAGLGVAAEAAAARAAAARAAASRVQFDREGTAITPGQTPTAPATSATTQTASPTQPGFTPGMTTAADQAARGTPLPEVMPPADEGTTTPALPVNAQGARAQTLADIGLKEARRSAITGDSHETGTDFQTSKLDNAAGERIQGVIDNERAALQSTAKDLVADSAGSVGTDQAALHARGETIAQPVKQLEDYYDGRTKELYTEADKRAAGIPAPMPTVNDFLTNNKADFLGTIEGKQLLEGVQARAKDLGMLNGADAVQPATVQQAERLRQSLGDQWTPRTGKLIGKLKDAIDEDVSAAAGEDIYNKSRAIRSQRATILDDPTGIAKLGSPEDRLGINRQVPLEQVPDYVTKQPVDQYRHIVRTLRDVPPEVQPAARNALNEIRAHFANRVDEIGNSMQGMWNAKGVSQYLAANKLRMAEVFSPEELARYKTLNDAGNILRMDRSYPGAAAQGHNFAVRGVLGAVEHGATAGGAVLGHIPGAIVGHAAGKIAGKISEKALLASVEKRIAKLPLSARNRIVRD